MALPAPLKSWQFDVNIGISGLADSMAVQRRFWRLLKNALIGFASSPWSVSYSCNGTVAGTAGDGVDRWTADSDVLFATSTGSAHGWTVLHNAATGMEILIEAITANTATGKHIRLVVSAAAGFTGGSTTSSPSATDQRVLFTGASGNGNWGLGNSTTTLAPEIVFHVLHSDDGEVTLIVVNHANALTGFAYFGVPDTPATGWTDPLLAGWYAASVSSATPPTPNPISWDHVFKTLTSVVTHERLYGLNFPASAAGFELHLVAPAVNVGNATNTTATVNETFGSNVPAVNDLSLQHEAPRIGLFCAIGGSRGFHGRLFDVRWMGDEVATGDTVPATGERDWVKQGPFLIPWDGSVPLIA